MRNSPHRSLGLGAALAAAFALAACTPPPPGESFLGIGSPPLQPGDPYTGWRAKAATADAALETRYCYRTLGVVDCHAAPLAGEADRRVGWFDMPVVR